jgi:hypothetical protein
MGRDCGGARIKNRKKEQGTRLQLGLKIKRTPYGFDRNAFGLEFVK